MVRSAPHGRGDITLKRPVLCLVTSRRRLAARLGCDAEGADIAGALVDQAEAAAAAGVALVQLREPGCAAGPLVGLARALSAALEPYGARLVVNDRVDVALAAGAGGVHLKASSVTVAEARRLVGGVGLVGRSVHGPSEVQAAAGADYLLFGTVFPTPSKPGARDLAGTAGLTAAVQAAGATPVLAIGGVTAESARHLAATGAAGLAAIGAFLPERGRDLRQSVQRAARRLQMAFDSTVALSYHDRNA